MTCPTWLKDNYAHIWITVCTIRDAIAIVIAFEKNHCGEGIGDGDGSSTVNCGDNGITVRRFVSLCRSANNDREPKARVNKERSIEGGRKRGTATGWKKRYSWDPNPSTGSAPRHRL
jgi:hypothetical protein